MGAALAAYYQYLGAKRDVSTGNAATKDGMGGAYLGPAYSNAEIEGMLQEQGAAYTKMEEEDLLSTTARRLAEGYAIGWFQGRMEFGPRALGNRSILADPRGENVQSELNLKIKFREAFRPFAPSVIAERATDWFDLSVDSPYMLMTAPVTHDKRISPAEDDNNLFGIEKLKVPRSQIPAVTHVDYSARVQTVSEAQNKRYYALLLRFEEITGCPVLVNTSFNVRGEPIVRSPEDAWRCFMGTNLDYLVIGDFVAAKSEQREHAETGYHHEFEAD